MAYGVDGHESQGQRGSREDFLAKIGNPAFIQGPHPHDYGARYARDGWFFEDPEDEDAYNRALEAFEEEHRKREVERRERKEERADYERDLRKDGER